MLNGGCSPTRQNKNPMKTSKTFVAGLALSLMLAAGLLAGCDEPADPQDAGLAADLVLTNGKIVTVDSLKPEAEALAIAAGASPVANQA